MKKIEFKDARNFSYHIEEGVATRIDPDPDIDFSYLDEKIQDVLGHIQKDFEGGISTENLGSKFGGYGSFLPTYKRSPSWSTSMSSHKELQQVSSKAPIHMSPLGVKVLSKHGNRFERPANSSHAKAIRAYETSPKKVISDSSYVKYNSVNGINSESSEQKPLKIRIKMGCDNSRPKNAAIYSNLGLDNSPSALESTSESEGIPNDPYDSIKHLTHIMKIMTVLPVQGVLMSPLAEKLIKFSDGNFCQNGITSTQAGKSDGLYENTNVDELVRRKFKLPILSVFEGQKALSKRHSKVVEGRKSRCIVGKSQICVEKGTLKQCKETNQINNVKIIRGTKTPLSSQHEKLHPSDESAFIPILEDTSDQKVKVIGNQSCSLNQADFPANDGVAGIGCDLMLQNSIRNKDYFGKTEDNTPILETNTRVSQLSAVCDHKWVQCDKCKQRRVLPHDKNPDEIPERWFCSMQHWLPGMNSCEITQDDAANAFSLKYHTPFQENQCSFPNCDQSELDTHEDILSKPKKRLNSGENVCNDFHSQQLISVEASTSVENGGMNMASLEGKNKKKSRLSNAIRQCSSDNEDTQSKTNLKRSPEPDSSNISKKVRTSREPDGWTSDGDAMFTNILNEGYQHTSPDMILKTYDHSFSKDSNHDRKNVLMDSRQLLNLEQIKTVEVLPIDEDSGLFYSKPIETSLGDSGEESGIVTGTWETKACSEIDCNFEKRVRDSKLNKLDTSPKTRVHNSLHTKLKIKATKLSSYDVKPLSLSKTSVIKSAKNDFGETKYMKNKDCSTRMVSEKVEAASFNNISNDIVKENTSHEKIGSTKAADGGRKFEENYRSDTRNSKKGASLRIADRNQLCDSDQSKAKVVDQCLQYEGKHIGKKNIDEEKSSYHKLKTKESCINDISLLPKASEEEPCTESPLNFEASVYLDASPLLIKPLQENLTYTKGVSLPRDKNSFYDTPSINNVSTTSTTKVNKEDHCKGIPTAAKSNLLLNKHRNGDSDAKVSARKDYSYQAASNSIKEAKSLKHMADRLKSERAFAESTKLYFESSLKFLYGASLLEKCDNAGAEDSEIKSTQVYTSTAELCKFCALEYEKSKDYGAAALAYKCIEVAYMRVLYHSHRSFNKDRHEIQAALQMVSPDGGKPKVSAQNRESLESLLRFVRDVDCAMESSRKSRSALSAAKSLRNSMQEETPLLIKSAIDFNFHDVEEFVHLVRVAFDSVTSNE